MRHIKIETGADGLAVLTMDNVDESMNLISREFIDEMLEVAAKIASDDSIKGVILRSGKSTFMAGADLKLMVQGYDSFTLDTAYEFSQKATAMHRAIEQSGKPWVALINGLALGGGFELALACHYRVLEQTDKAVVGLPEVNVGLLPGSGGTQRLIRIAGVKAGLDLLLSGRAVRGPEALELGIVDALVPSEELKQAALSWLSSEPDPVRPWDVKGYGMAERSGLILPDHAARMIMATASLAKAGYNNPAPLAILSCIYEGAILPFDKALSVESKYFAQLLTNPVSRNIIRTTFLSKNAAEHGARRPSDIPRATFRKVGVLGAGMMGAGIALVSARAGCEVVLIDKDEALAAKGKAYSEKAFAKLVKKGRISEGERDETLARITPATDFALLAGCDIVVEAVFEDIAIKAEAIHKVEAVVDRSTLFCSNTSTLPITGLAESSQRPGQFIGMHFFSPVDRMGLVEIIKGEKTSPETLARALDFVALIRKTPIVVNDSRGFYTSRVFQTFIHEGAVMLEDGVPPAVVENAAKAAGMPMGPLALLDEVTFDLPLKIVDQAIAQEGEKYLVPAGADVLRKMMAQNRSSKKQGGGFYDYPEDAPKKIWAGLEEMFPPRSDYEFGELKQRFLHIQALETARCLEENVIETPEDADLGAIYGWGYPAWTGGTLSYIDTIGIVDFVTQCDKLAQKYGPRFAPSTWLRQRATDKVGFY